METGIKERPLWIEHDSQDAFLLLLMENKELPVQRTRKSEQLLKVLHFFELLYQTDAALPLWDERRWDLNNNTWMNERTNEWTNERMNERTNERTNEIFI